MDVVELDGIKEIYRLVPLDGILLKPIVIKDTEKTKKLVIVKSKTTIKNGKMQIGFHDGRSLIDDTTMSVGDTCLIQTPEQKILEVIKLEKGTHGLIIKGINAGQVGTIKEVKEGTFILPKRVDLKIGNRQIEIPANLIMPIGKEESPIQIR
jgi:small subunit ribosomal protein S4e